MKGLLLTFSCVFALAHPLLGQRPDFMFIEAGGAYSDSSRTPFWLHANQYGIIPTEGRFGTFRVGAYRDYSVIPDSADRTTAKPRFYWGYGLNVVANVTSSVAVLIPEVYTKARFGIFQARAGRWRQVIGLADSTLGVGPYSWSGNALPLPRVEISIPTFTPIGFTKGLIAVRGSYAHGWFDNQGAIKNFYLHQKDFYARLGKDSWPVRFYAGLNHQVQWGGRSDEITNPLFVKNGKLPSSFRDYLDVVTGASLPARQTTDTTRLPTIDSNNRVGNHLGSADVGIELVNPRFSVLAYRQFIYDDGSLVHGNNISDGLTGIRFISTSLVNRGFQFRHIVLEMLDTRSQGGPEFTLVDATRGQDEYFNNLQYVNGWSYLGRTLGSPFIPPQTDTRSNLPRIERQADDFREFTNNNRVRVFHVGLAGNFLRHYRFQFKCSVSDNRGRYLAPFPYHTWQTSSYLHLGIPLKLSKGLWANLILASDRGLLYTNSNGIFFSIRKEWLNKAIANQAPGKLRPVDLRHNW